jgi:hypothetical protein
MGLRVLHKLEGAGAGGRLSCRNLLKDDIRLVAVVGVFTNHKSIRHGFWLNRG